ncbi:glutaminyl-peptide cyclotransferase [Streptomyces sp. NPDC001634]|uniref:glutaminyl-peptide cyclotransferase n=1 Tax=Streptomyces sp. NPDC001634 TaxID=3154390 RepID=UPI00332EC9B4
MVAAASFTVAATLLNRAEPSSDTSVEHLRAEVLQVLPHDEDAFTEGLELSDGLLFESTGGEGGSSIRVGPPAKPPDRQMNLPAPLFGEGLTVLGQRLWQITWQNGVAIERDAKTLRELRRVTYSGEGWGLCHESGKKRLVMSDGTSHLAFRDPDTFAEVGGVEVTQQGKPVPRINELECSGDSVYANLWETDRIVRIDPATGHVTAEVDASGLLTPDEKSHASVLNGIAAIPGTGEFLLTGKYWPKTFRVSFRSTTR